MDMNAIAEWSCAVVMFLVLFGGGCGHEDVGDPNAATADVEVQAEAVEFVRAGHPREVDIYSGDVRGSRYRADGSSVYGIYESELSREVRRLGIAVPERRKWFPVSVISSGGNAGQLCIREPASDGQQAAGASG
jgi:hypothetical protein